jgi:chaperonin cofactor prefoldin
MRYVKQREIKKIDTRIKTIRKAAQELEELSGEIPAVDRNAGRILASVKMLEINISDLLELEAPSSPSRTSVDGLKIHSSV